MRPVNQKCEGSVCFLLSLSLSAFICFSCICFLLFIFFSLRLVIFFLAADYRSRERPNNSLRKGLWKDFLKVSASPSRHQILSRLPGFLAQCSTTCHFFPLPQFGLILFLLPLPHSLSPSCVLGAVFSSFNLCVSGPISSLLLCVSALTLCFCFISMLLCSYVLIGAFLLFSNLSPPFFPHMTQLCCHTIAFFSPLSSVTLTSVWSCLAAADWQT